MFNNGEIFNNLDTIIRKEKEGQTISPAQFSELLLMCSWEKANADFSYFEQNQVITDSLRLLETESNITITAGTGDISSLTDYWHAINANHAQGTKALTPIDIVTDVEYSEYAFSDLVQPTLEYPVLTISADSLLVLPTTITSIGFRYLKKPDNPFFDYYFDVNDNIQYLTPGQMYILQPGEEYRDGTTSGTVTSISVELSFPEGERVSVLYMILEKLGVALNEQDALQYGLAREQKEEVQ